MAITLDEVVHAYLDDTEFQTTRQRLSEKRYASIPDLQNVTRRFINAETNIQAFRSQLERTLRAREDWGATGYGFMMELNKFGKYHSDTSPVPEEELRATLAVLDARVLGARIERFYNFLLDERERLRREGKSSNMIVAARNSAFIISLFACWLDPDGGPLIYYDSVRKGFYLLIKANLLPVPPGLQLGAGAVEVRTARDHDACLGLVEYIGRSTPQVVQSFYWAEFFCLWIVQHLQSLTEPSTTLVKETDDAALLAASPTQKNVVREDEAAYTLTPPADSQQAEPGGGALPTIKHEPLLPNEEPLLSRLIQEVQRHILIDEKIIRRIYHALLAGHVILTGPPGTGKTELARLIPEILWQSTVRANEQDETATDDTSLPELTTRTAYTTRLVTATDEWSVRTLISGLAPQTRDGAVTYNMQYGYLTMTILKNWSFQGSSPAEWSSVTLQRTTITAPGFVARGKPQPFRGQWLVIDEFNRAPIDLALGDALTALGGNDVLRVSIEGGSAELPIPFDFRVIGTLNSFDRNYLNQISEALKRRFSFVEILPPTRAMRTAEQNIVLYKSLRRVSHLSKAITGEDNNFYWDGVLTIGFEPSGFASVLWDEEPHPFRDAFEAAWRLFEIIRIYRQLGTAQAISLFRHMLIAGLLQGYTTREDWLTEALDAALCDSLADQLQVLLPDEIEALLLYLTTDHAHFAEAYNALLVRLASTPQRLYGQLLALGTVCREDGRPLLPDEQIEQIAAQDLPAVPSAILTELFHLSHPDYRLPQFARRLRTFKTERGL